MVRYGMVLYGMVWCGMEWHGMVCYGMVWWMCNNMQAIPWKAHLCSSMCSLSFLVHLSRPLWSFISCHFKLKPIHTNMENTETCSTLHGNISSKIMIQFFDHLPADKNPHQWWRNITSEGHHLQHTAVSYDLCTCSLAVFTTYYMYPRKWGAYG